LVGNEKYQTFQMAASALTINTNSKTFVEAPNSLSNSKTEARKHFYTIMLGIGDWIPVVASPAVANIVYLSLLWLYTALGLAFSAVTELHVLRL